MERDAPPARPPRRRHRGRRGGGGAAAPHKNEQTPPLQPHQGPSTSAPLRAPLDPASPPPSTRKRGARKNRRGRGGGAAPAAAADSELRDGASASPTTSARASADGDFRTERSARSSLDIAPHPRAEVKVVVRRLPPRMSCEQFFEDAGPRGASLAVWRSYHAGSIGGIPGASAAAAKRPGIFTRHSTAHLAFASLAHATAFFEALNGHRLVDPKSGVEYIARVERALFQVVPRAAYYASKKPSALHGTIENDAHYKRFLEELKIEQDRAAADSDSTTLLPRIKPKGPAPVTLTKLMEDVRARRRERVERKTPKAPPGSRSTRRRGRRAAAAAAAAAAGMPGGGKPIVFKLPHSVNGVGNGSHGRDKSKTKSGRPSRAAKRAAAAAAAAAANMEGGNAEGDGVYVMHVAGERKLHKPAPNTVAANALALAASRNPGHVSPSRPPPRRKGKPRVGAPPPFAGGGPGRPPIRLLRKEPSIGANGNGASTGSNGQVYGNGT